jgi:antitoxin (DNA-binding transcriptional repressor) of toxin-antitoxin stability system
VKIITSCQAKARWSALLDCVAKGEQFAITRRGVSLAVLKPPCGVPKADLCETVKAMMESRKGHRLDGLSNGDMIEEGRR